MKLIKPDLSAEFDYAAGKTLTRTLGELDCAAQYAEEVLQRIASMRHYPHEVRNYAKMALHGMHCILDHE